MGREATTRASWRGTTAEVKVIAEADEIILRGAIKAKLPRSGITATALQSSALTIHFGPDQLVLELGEVQAEKWQKLLLTPPPTLAQKLGISPQKPAFVSGRITDPVLMEALTAATVTEPEDSTCLISVIENEADLNATLELAGGMATLPVWCIYPKGRQANPGDAQIRHVLRAAGFMDNKSCAVSPKFTATRYAQSGPRSA